MPLEQGDACVIPLVAQAIPLGFVVVAERWHAGWRDRARYSRYALRIILKAHHSEVAKASQVTQEKARFPLPPSLVVLVTQALNSEVVSVVRRDLPTA